MMRHNCRAKHYELAFLFYLYPTTCATCDAISPQSCNRDTDPFHEREQLKRPAKAKTQNPFPHFVTKAPYSSGCVCPFLTSLSPSLWPSPTVEVHDPPAAPVVGVRQGEHALDDRLRGQVAVLLQLLHAHRVGAVLPRLLHAKTVHPPPAGRAERSWRSLVKM